MTRCCRSPVAARLGAHQPHRRLPLAQQRQDRRGQVQARYDRCNRLSVLYLMRWSLPPSQYYAEDRLSFGEPSWKTLRLLVSIWVRTLSIFIVRIIVGRPFTVKIHPTKANRISGDMPGNNHRDGSLWRFSLYGTQAGRVRAFSKADITAICPPIR